MLKKIMLSFMVGVLILGVLTGCKSSEPTDTKVATTVAQTQSEVIEPETKIVTIGFSVSTLTNDFFVAMKEAGDVESEKLGIQLVSLDAQDSTEMQATQIEDLITQKVDLLIINPVDSDAISTSVKAANEAGIPVITVTRPANGGTVVQHLDIDNKEAGALDAEQLIKDLGGKGKVAVLEGIAGAPSAVDRQAGFVDKLKAEAPEIEITTSLTANYSREEGATVTEDILQSNPELNAIYAHNDEMALGAVRAVTASGRMDEIKIYGIDATPDAIAALKTGEMMATVQQQPDVQMQTALKNAVKVLNGEMVEPLVNIPLKLLTRDNVDN